MASSELPRPRRVDLDWARGVAVLLMVGWHTLDAWTRQADRQSTAFGWVLIAGGFAAPLFLWVAGAAVALSAAGRTMLGHPRASVSNAICRRGLEIFVLAFLFRLQAFIVTPGSPAISIFRVDILNIMGVAIVGAGAAWAAAGSAAARAGLFAATAAAIAMLTPVVRALPAVTALPDWIEWYLAPAGDLTTFTLFPWAAFLFAGAACGAVLAGTADRASEHRAQFAFAACGTALVVAGYYLSFRPSIYEQSSFWTSSPTWFAIRLGVLMIGAAAVHALAEATYAAGVSCRPLERLGRHSLFVYWVHVELVYGYASWPLRSRLPLWAAVAGCVGFGLLMYRAIGLRDRFAAHPALRRYVPRLVLRHRPAHGQLT